MVVRGRLTGQLIAGLDADPATGREVFDLWIKDKEWSFAPFRFQPHSEKNREEQYGLTKKAQKG